MAEKYAEKINPNGAIIMRKFMVLLAAALVLSLASCNNININPETTKAEPATTTAEITTAEETETVTETETETKTETETETEEATTEAETEKESERYVYEGVSLILPEGFSVDSMQGTTLAVYEDYPLHSDNISFVLASEYDVYDAFTERALYESFKQSYDIENFKYERSESADYKLVKAEYDILYNGVSMHQKNCTFFFGKAVSITFTSVSGEFDAAFEQTLQSVQIVK